jgi:NIMA (never in mitosis gene a)-related kinase
MSLKDFEIGKELGKGAFGSVSICKRKEDGKLYAMKRVKISQLSTKERENALNEVRILASLSHSNIIGYKEAFFDEDSKTLNIVMQIADDGDIESKIQKAIKTGTKIPEDTIWSYLIQIIQGLKYLHDNSIMHRDLKCANVFLIKDGTLKLGDLNVSKIVKMGMVYTQTGTPYYASPEVWGDKPYNYKSDLWSVGCILYELCALRPPFKGTSLENLYKNVIKGIYEPISNIYSKDMSTLIGMLLQVNPMNRPTCEQILNNEIVIKHKYCIKGDANEVVEKTNMLCTIKYPKNMNEINSRLPKKKKYAEMGMIEEDKKIEESKMGNNDQNINRPRIIERDMKKEKELKEMKEQLQRERELLMIKEREREREIQREKEILMQREKEREREREIQREKEILMQREKERERQREIINSDQKRNENRYNPYSRPISAKVPGSDRPRSPLGNNRVIMNNPINNYNRNIGIANNINNVKPSAISPRPISAKDNKIIPYQKPNSPKIVNRDNKSPLRVGQRVPSPGPVNKVIPDYNRPISAKVIQGINRPISAKVAPSKPVIEKINYKIRDNNQQKLVGKIEPILRSNPMEANYHYKNNQPVSKPVRVTPGPRIVHIKK